MSGRNLSILNLRISNDDHDDIEIEISDRVITSVWVNGEDLIDDEDLVVSINDSIGSEFLELINALLKRDVEAA